MTTLTAKLRVASAAPEPPFELERNGSLTGFDIERMRTLTASVGLTWQPCRYEGADFNGIFDGLADGSWAVVANRTARAG